MNPQKSILYKYAELLDSCKRARLTGTRGADEIFTLQIMDCLPSVEFLPEKGRVVDVGSGGGLPGIVWAVQRPDLRITLLDSISKKCAALNEIIEALGIKNAEAVCSRSEDFARIKRETFDMAGARALSSAGVTAELLSPLVKKGGRLLTFKGEKVNDEIAALSNKWKILGLSEPELHYYGGDDSSRCILLWDKVKNCPAMFPRRTGLAGTKFFWE
ncbi:MAG: 16S rRNA (guanine(527)-N(7))-methyltransferase RsmG [Synergistaceae bacterium]|nr:16S rRNA (guanine(527)-N(7))-methyltransferase RsmG [Synergistaceae bacterium]